MTKYQNSFDVTHNILMATFSTIKPLQILNGLSITLKPIWKKKYYPLSSSIDSILKIETRSIIILTVSLILLSLSGMPMAKLLELTHKRLLKRDPNVIIRKDSWWGSKIELFFMSKINLCKGITKSSIQDLSPGIKITSFLVTLT